MDACFSALRGAVDTYADVIGCGAAEDTSEKAPGAGTAETTTHSGPLRPEETHRDSTTSNAYVLRSRTGVPDNTSKISRAGFTSTRTLRPSSAVMVGCNMEGLSKPASRLASGSSGGRFLKAAVWRARPENGSLRACVGNGPVCHSRIRRPAPDGTNGRRNKGPEVRDLEPAVLRNGGFHTRKSQALVSVVSARCYE